jgi:hypothetical protein
MVAAHATRVSHEEGSARSTSADCPSSCQKLWCTALWGQAPQRRRGHRWPAGTHRGGHVGGGPPLRLGAEESGGTADPLLRREVRGHKGQRPFWIGPTLRLAESEAESAEISASPRASASFWALVPKMEAICGGGLIFPREGQPAEVQGIPEKRLMGFEPTTFCMAIRPTFDSRWPRIYLFAGVS